MVGKQNAKPVADVAQNEKAEVEAASDNIDNILFTRLHALGLLFSHATTTHWYLCVASSHHYEFDFQIHSEEEVTLKFTGSKPDISSLLYASSKLDIRPDEWGFEDSSQISTTLRIRSPRPLSTDKSKIMTCSFPTSSPDHYYLRIPFYSEKEEESELHFGRKAWFTIIKT